MKRVGLLLLIALLLLMFGSCSFEKTYYADMAALAGLCFEITTTDSDLQKDIEATPGWEEGTCSTSNSVGKCRIPSGGSGIDAEATLFYYSPIWDSSTAQSDCTTGGGTWL